ncbi:MAG: hypothetical protein ACOC6L_04685, partial [Thermodesulfobacteriota bacterium]
RLALRNQANKDFFSTRGVDTAQLLNKAPAPEPKVFTAPESVKRDRLRAQLIKGMSVSVTEF